MEQTTRTGYIRKLDSTSDPSAADTRSVALTRKRWNRSTPCSAAVAIGATAAAAPTTCRPLAPATVRQIHAILSAALARAVRWNWRAVNPAEAAEAPAAPKPDPQPPSVDQAARILEEAWCDPDWGMLVWLAMVTGARRGELCALAWDRLDFATGVLTIRTSIAQDGKKTWEKDTKTHQQPRITLDDQTLALLPPTSPGAGTVPNCSDSSCLLTLGCSLVTRTAVHG